MRNFDPLTIDRRWDGADEQRRAHHPLNAFAERERGTLLDAMLYYWGAKRASRGRIPRIGEFQPDGEFPASLLGRCYSVDVGTSDPAGFVVRKHPGGPLDRLHGGLANKRLVDFPSRIHAEASVAEYDLCRRLGEPLYHEIDQIVGGYARWYFRLMLPLADETGRVVRIAYCVRHAEPVSKMF